MVTCLPKKEKKKQWWGSRVCVCVCVCVCVRARECMLSGFSCVPLFAILWTVALQAPLSMGFSRQEYWSWVAMPFSRGSSQARDWTNASYISLNWQMGSLPLVPPGKPKSDCVTHEIPKVNRGRDDEKVELPNGCGNVDVIGDLGKKSICRQRWSVSLHEEDLKSQRKQQRQPFWRALL